MDAIPVDIASQDDDWPGSVHPVVKMDAIPVDIASQDGKPARAKP